MPRKGLVSRRKQEVDPVYANDLGKVYLLDDVDLKSTQRVLRRDGSDGQKTRMTR
jgi:hypothetical protein